MRVRHKFKRPVPQTRGLESSIAFSVGQGHALNLGLTDELLEVMQGPEATRRIQADIKEARALKVEGTPTVYANGVRLKYWDTEASLERQILASQRNTAPRPVRSNRPDKPSS